MSEDINFEEAVKQAKDIANQLEQAPSQLTKAINEVMKLFFYIIEVQGKQLQEKDKIIEDFKNRK